MRLQDFQLHGIQILTQLVLFLHEGVHLFYHIIEACLKLPDFIRTVHNAVYIEISAFHSPNLFCQKVDSFCVLSSIETGQTVDNDSGNQDQQDELFSQAGLHA